MDTRKLTKVLDHGSVEVINITASDQDVLRAMLVSTGQDENNERELQISTYGDPVGMWPVTDRIIAKNKGRINYLMREHHGTPFEHNMFKFRVTAPIFVLREWHRHRIGWSYNEQSGRYMELDNKWYIPGEVRTRVGKPGHYLYLPISREIAEGFRAALVTQCEASYRYYRSAIEAEVAPEQARLFLHVNHYSSMYATCNARSLMAFLTLRNDPTAQWEIQQYAEVLEQHLKEAMPFTYEAYVKNGRIAP